MIHRTQYNSTAISIYANKMTQQSLSTFLASVLFSLQNNPTQDISANIPTVKYEMRNAKNTLGFIEEGAVIL
jgi:hypothetical protein